MAVIWKKTIASNKYKVTNAGGAVRLYRNKVLHSQWNASKPVSGKLWDLFLLSSFDGKMPINKVLVLGAGGGAIINLIHHFFPKCHVDAIDLDDTHLYIAKKYFKVSNKHCTLIHDDVKSWLAINRDKKYDLIIDDVFFESDNIPYRSVQVQAHWVESLLKRLKKQGALVINFADKKEWAKSYQQLTRRRLTSKYQFAMATHYACENKIVHISKNNLSKKIIRQNLNNKSHRQYMSYFNDGIISYRKLTKKMF
ncbi:MAG: spermidine synthase [Gammaproteobacteria bacterium]